VCDPWWSRATSRHHAWRWLGAGSPGQGINKRPRLRFSRISIARCADPGPLLRVCLGPLALTASPPHRGSACHRPKSHAPGTFALAALRAGCGRGNRWLARTRADGELRRGGRSPWHLDGIEPSHRVRLSGRVRSAGTAAPAGWVRAQASRAMKLQMVTSAREHTMAGSSPAATWPGSRYISLPPRGPWSGPRPGKAPGRHPGPRTRRRRDRSRASAATAGHARPFPPQLRAPPRPAGAVLPRVRPPVPGR
jgi:hypothetical protein